MFEPFMGFRKNNWKIVSYQIYEEHIRISQLPDLANSWNRSQWLEPKIFGFLNPSKSSFVGRFHMMDSSKKISWNWSNNFEEFPWFFVGLMEEMPLDEEGLARTPDGRVTCLKCFQTFSNMSNGERHYRSRHMNLEKVQCKFCQRTFKNIYSHNEHLRQSHGLSQTMLKSRIVPKNPEFT